jgi:hypothetical protein
MKLTQSTAAKRIAIVGAIGIAFYLGMLIKNEFGIWTARDGQFPWHAQVVNSDLCGGFLIAPDWVVTAAHCVRQSNIDTLILTGDKRLNLGVRSTAKHVIVHSNYPRHWDPNQQQPDRNLPKDFDIALVQLGTPANPNKTSTIGIVDVGRNDTYTDVFISGWICGSDVIGRIKRFLSFNGSCGGLVYTDVRPRLKPENAGFCKDRDRFICAIGPLGTRAGFNQYDSGGALTTGTVVGAGAVGIALHVHEEADVYLRLSSYEAWLAKCMTAPATAAAPAGGITTRYSTCTEP